MADRALPVMGAAVKVCIPLSLRDTPWVSKLPYRPPETALTLSEGAVASILGAWPRRATIGIIKLVIPTRLHMPRPVVLAAALCAVVLASIAAQAPALHRAHLDTPSSACPDFFAYANR